MNPRNQGLGHKLVAPSCRNGASARVFPALALALALGILATTAWADIPGKPSASPTDVAEAKRVLEANGYGDIAIVSSDGRLIMASAVKDGEKRVLDVDLLTQIILPHSDLPPIPPRLAPITGLGKRS